MIVLLGSGKYAGRYDWFPEDEPLPEGAVVVNRWEDGRWIDVDGGFGPRGEDSRGPGSAV